MCTCIHRPMDTYVHMYTTCTHTHTHTNTHVYIQNQTMTAKRRSSSCSATNFLSFTPILRLRQIMYIIYMFIYRSSSVGTHVVCMASQVYPHIHIYWQIMYIIYMTIEVDYEYYICLYIDHHLWVHTQCAWRRRNILTYTYIALTNAESYVMYTIYVYSHLH